MGSILVFVATVGFVWHYAGINASVNADAVIEPYLFSGWAPHDAVLPGNHPVVIKWLAIWVQSLVPYNLTTFYVFNGAVSAGAVFLWAGLLIAMFGRKFAPLVLIALSGILAGSTSLGGSLFELTQRNIEYPIGLAFLFLCDRLYRGRAWSRSGVLVGILIWLTFVVTLTGDSLMIVAFCAPPIIVAGALAARDHGWKRNSTLILLVALAAAVASVLLRKLIETTGLVDLDYTTSFVPQVVKIENLPASLGTALSQLLSLSGAGIFGSVIEAQNALLFVNATVVVLGIVGLALLAREGWLGRVPQTMLACALAMSALLTFGSYALSPLVVHSAPDGQLVDSGVMRYLTLMPFLLVAGFVYFVSRLSFRWLSALLPIAVVLCMALSLPTVFGTSYAFISAADERRAAIQRVIAAADANGVEVVAGGYWDPMLVRFYSADRIESASIMDCYIPSPVFNLHRSWYEAEVGTTSALLVDRAGQDAYYWSNCTEAQIASKYGRPISKLDIDGVGGNTFELWIYPYDVRRYFSPLK